MEEDRNSMAMDKKAEATLDELLREGTEWLAESDVETAGYDAEHLLLHLAGLSKTELFLRRREPAGAELVSAYRRAVRQRAEGEPLQYIMGTQGFMDFDFIVNPSVLIPRPETELLVEHAVREAKARLHVRKNSGSSPVAGKDARDSLRILDLCCGSGAIGISMACYLPEAEVTVCDISPAALDVAERNAVRCGVADRVHVVRSDMFQNLRGGTWSKSDVAECGEAVAPRTSGRETGIFDMILSNPPYIPHAVIATLQREVRDHEPVSALDGGADGLDFYRVIAAEAAEYLSAGGFLMMEIGHDQAEAICDLLKRAGRYEDIHIRQDLQGRDRLLTCREFSGCRGNDLSSI